MAKRVHYNFFFKPWNIISNAWFLGIFPATLIILLLPEIFEKYNFELQTIYNRKNSETLIYYQDIDNDGIDEKITFANYIDENAYCLYYDTSDKPVKQINFEGSFPKARNIIEPEFIDIDADGFKEAIVYTQTNDSVFINIISFKNFQFITNHRFVSTIGGINNKTDFALYAICNFDQDKDGTLDIYFTIHAGFSLYPRRIFRYNTVTNSLVSTPNYGVKLLCYPYKIKKDSLLLFCLGNSTDNCKPNYPVEYLDSANWVFIFDQNLKLTNNPSSLGSTGTYLIFTDFVGDKFQFFYSNNKLTHRVVEMDQRGDFIQYEIKEQINFGVPYTIKTKKETRYFCTDTKMDMPIINEYFPDSKSFIHTKICDQIGMVFFAQEQINQLNEPVFIGLNNKTGQKEIAIGGFKYRFTIPKEIINVGKYNSYFQTTPVNQGDLIFLLDDETIVAYLISRNHYFNIRYLIFLFIYLLSSSFIYLAQLLQKRQISKREKLQKKIAALQLQLVNSQLDPHFTFNTLNTVSSKILKGEKFEAYDLMTNFSRMMRSAMLFSNKESWTLEEELKFTSDYLVLMKARFQTLFDFEILNADNIELNKIITPRLLIQNFAENAIKHAFTDINYRGQIKIEVLKKENGIEVIITDNGIGREKAMENFEKAMHKSGKGLGLIKQQVAIYNRLNNTNIRFEISNNGSSGELPGTVITIVIPY